MTNNLTTEQQAVIDEIAGRLLVWADGYGAGDLPKLAKRWLPELTRTGLIQPKEEE